MDAYVIYINKQQEYLNYINEEVWNGIKKYV
jgi:hypothetical protein